MWLSLGLCSTCGCNIYTHWGCLLLPHRQTEPARGPKNRKETKRKNLTEKNSDPFMCLPWALSLKPGVTYRRIVVRGVGIINTAVPEGSASKTRPTMCGTRAGERNTSKTLLLYSRNLKGFSLGKIIDYKAPIIYSKSGIKRFLKDRFSTHWDFRVTLRYGIHPKKQPQNKAVLYLTTFYTHGIMGFFVQ